MKINMMRMLDYYLGPLFCRLLLFVRLFSRSSRLAKNIQSQLKEDCRNILIIKFFGIGSILLLSPTLRELKRKYKYAKITILTLHSNRELCQLLPSVDGIICLRVNTALDFLTSFIRDIFEIRRRNFNIIIDMEFLTNFTSLVVLLTTLFNKPKLTVGFSSPSKWRNSVYSINVSFDHARHISGIFAKVVRSLRQDDYHDCFEISFEPERKLLLEKMDPAYMKDLLAANKDLAQCNFIICVNINAGVLCLHRRWPKEYFAEIVNGMMSSLNVAVLLIGGKEDMEYVSDFKRHLSLSSRIVDVCGKTNIRELIGLFRGSSLLITNDSGPLHIAELIGLPTLSFFGPETPYLYGPLNKEHHVFYQDLYCSPCLSIYNSKTSRCRDNVCLKAIKPEKVLEVIKNKYLSLSGKDN